MPISDILADRFVALAVDLDRGVVGINREVIKFLRGLEAHLSSQISIFVDDGSLKSRSSRLLLNQIRETISDVYDGLSSTVSDRLIELSRLDLVAISSIYSSVIADQILSTPLSKNFLESIVRTDEVAGGVTSNWWKRQARDLYEKYRDEVNLGLALGETTSEILKRVRGVSTGGFESYTTTDGVNSRKRSYVGGILSVSERNAEALVRSTTQSVLQRARDSLYRENSDVIKGVQVLAVLDSRTSKICMALSGQAWTLEGEPLGNTTREYPGRPPYHWRCRSTLLPVTKSWEELSSGLSDKKLRAINSVRGGSLQSSLDGKVSGDLNYEDWLKTKSAKFQLGVLGAGRYRLWKDGKLSFRDLTDNSNNPLTLRQLYAKYGVIGGSDQSITRGSLLDRNEKLTSELVSDNRRLAEENRKLKRRLLRGN